MLGLWLLQLGTPSAPSRGAVSRYLKEFLTDPRMIDIPTPFRQILVRGVIAPLRAGKSAHAYQSVWMPGGSPLLVYSLALQQRLQEVFGDRVIVELGMRYGSPSMEESWKRLRSSGVDRLVICPLFPQYAGASWGSAVEKSFRILAKEDCLPSVRVVPPFFRHPGYINAWKDSLTSINIESFDHFLFSYHGLPEDYVKRTAKACFTPGCCDQVDDRNIFCYRAQCFETSRLIQKEFGIPAEKSTVCFQSRLGPKKWLEPYTDQVIQEIRKTGKKRVLVFSPAFVADCLETLEELKIRLKEDFIKLGGEDLQLVPSLNSSDSWIEGLTQILEPHIKFDA